MPGRRGKEEAVEDTLSLPLGRVDPLLSVSPPLPVDKDQGGRFD